MGDIPIYVSLDSADVWAHRELFQLDESRPARRRSPASRPTTSARPASSGATRSTAGSASRRRATRGGSARIRANLRLCDLLRIDHFRAFAAYWSVPATETTAINGSWQPGPGPKLFDAVRAELGDGPLPIVAEDLGRHHRRGPRPARRSSACPG